MAQYLTILLNDYSEFRNVLQDMLLVDMPTLLMLLIKTGYQYSKVLNTTSAN